MIIPKYVIRTTEIPNAGKGLFLTQDVENGRIIVAPDGITQIMPLANIKKFGADSIEYKSNVRWFEEHYTITPEWSDECYVNHSFTPTGLWHLGFIFAMGDLPASTEVTIDYRFLLGENEFEFKDSQTGEAVVGFSWQENISKSTAALYNLLLKKYATI
ncbi:MAG: hypothetical protein BWK79_08220 [Beggiatoa sp. IS2]|nr:MAG: hypothetical protein BWK79_08220 [Beggiatoa sp. IS2]